MKHPITWHKENLENSRHYVNTLKRDLKNLQDRITRIVDSNSLLEQQIEVAEDSGKTEFDADKYLQKNKMNNRSQPAVS